MKVHTPSVPGNPFAGSNKSSEGLAFRPGHKDSE